MPDLVADALERRRRRRPRWWWRAAGTRRSSCSATPAERGRRPPSYCWTSTCPASAACETLAELKGDAALRRIPVVVLTTSKSQNEIDRCYELGAAAVLNKPMRLREYREMLCAFERFWLGHVRLPERS